MESIDWSLPYPADHLFPQNEDWKIMYLASTRFRRVNESVGCHLNIQALAKIEGYKQENDEMSPKVVCFEYFSRANLS